VADRRVQIVRGTGVSVDIIVAPASREIRAVSHP